MNNFEEVPFADLRKGDIIFFYPNRDGETLVLVLSQPTVTTIAEQKYGFFAYLNMKTNKRENYTDLYPSGRIKRLINE